ncbi:hypothetical protein Ancab_004287 [Ancistrocladus abbreviatus]
MVTLWRAFVYSLFDGHTFGQGIGDEGASIFSVSVFGNCGMASDISDGRNGGHGFTEFAEVGAWLVRIGSVYLRGYAIQFSG